MPPFCALFFLFATRSKRLLRLGVVAIAATTRLTQALAMPSPPETLNSYQHTAFQRHDGAPGDIASVAQTSDGFLWMAGTKGLTRFDGTEFKPFHPVSGEQFLEVQLNNIFPAEGGGLWISNESAGPTLLKDGHLTHFDAKRGYMGYQGTFFADAHGAVWAMSSNALMRFDGHSWHVIKLTKPHYRFISGDFDRNGDLWVIAHTQLWVRPHDSDAFIQVSRGPDYPRHVFVGASGRLYILTKSDVHIYRPHGTTLTELTAPIPFLAYGGMEDKNGSLWLTSVKGVNFVPSDALHRAESGTTTPLPIESVSQLDGLSGNFPWPVIQDREGDIWVGTQAGLDRFRPAAFAAINLPEGIHEVSASVDAKGNIWVGSETHNVLHILPPAPSEVTNISGLTMATYYDAPTDTVWSANLAGVWQLAPGTPHLSIPFESLVPDGNIACLAKDRKGNTYVCNANDRGGLHAWNGKVWRDALGQPFSAKTLAVDERDNLWVGGNIVNSLLEVTNGNVQTFDQRQNLKVGSIKAIFPDKALLWVGGGAGVQFFDGKRFVSLLAQDPDAFKPTTGLIRDANGNLWIQTLDGVLRVASTEVQRAISQPNTFVTYRLFDSSDGVQGAPDPDRTLPTLRLSGDGLIWAQTISGLAWIDPNNIPNQPPPPIAHIETLTSGANSYPILGKSARIPPNQRTLRIAYTVPELAWPERIHFLYRLIGYNNSWQDAGTRKEATYTNLPPGSYQFEVKAANTDGVTSPSASTITLTVVPAFYETWWFRALIALPLAFLLWILHLIHVRVLAKQAEIRAEEREAVSRDIHDTLLQRIQGLTLVLQIWAADSAIPKKRREEIAAMSDQARSAMIEGRERVLSLRRHEDHGLALYDELMAEGRQLESTYKMAFSLNILGAPQEIDESCQRELRDIGLEAMRNAFTHSNGSMVRVALNYESNALWLTVSDDGLGLEQAQVSRASTNGHFGLICMSERAERLQGTFDIKTSPNEGAEIQVKIPAHRAYLHMKRSKLAFFYSLLKRFTSREKSIHGP